jgi:hypothetical protein
LLLAGSAAIGFAGWRIAGREWGMRWGLGGLAAGLLPYNYVALGLPGGADFAMSSGIGGVILISGAGLLAGWLGAWFWWRSTTRRGEISGADHRRGQPE